MCLTIKTKTLEPLDPEKPEIFFDSSTTMPAPMVAKKDMIVFKFGERVYPDETFCPFFFTYEYRKGVAAPKVEMNVHYTCLKWAVDEGYHAYPTKKDFLQGIKDGLFYSIASSQMYSLFVKLDTLNAVKTETDPDKYKKQVDECLKQMEKEKTRIAKDYAKKYGGVFVIPKGSKYYRGVYGDIVSDCIMYLKSYSEWEDEQK